MVHYTMFKQGDKGTSRGGKYHNKAFKREAEYAGLIVEKMEKHGWALTKLGDRAQRAVDDLQPDVDAFGVFRREVESNKKKAKKRLKKLSCGCAIVYGDTNKEFYLTCDVCGSEFVEC